MLGIASAYNGRYDTARTAFFQALQRDSLLPEARVGLAGVATALGDSSLADSALGLVRESWRGATGRARMRRFVLKYPAVYPSLTHYARP